MSNFDEDSPELDAEQLKSFHRISKAKQDERRKETVTIRLSSQSLKTAKALGKGYTSVLARIFENALCDPETIKKNL
ncbi:MAG TPA: BrnA antitoxin family protein [Lachnospiraceae bacterium]|nr:BrnA antitoxin family protein [Lachnospiraceae bacterium]